MQDVFEVLEELDPAALVHVRGLDQPEVLRAVLHRDALLGEDTAAELSVPSQELSELVVSVPVGDYVGGRC